MLTLDGSVSPYLPTREILEALDCPCWLDVATPVLAEMTRDRLALLHGVASERIALFPNDRTRLDRLLTLRSGAPLAVFPPSEQDLCSVREQCEVLCIERSDRLRIEAPQIEAIPAGAAALVLTPNDPVGTALGFTGAAQLARRTSLLALDERSAEMQRRSMIPLVEEFDSIVLLRSFGEWAGLGEDAPGYAITTAGIAGELDRSEELSRQGLNAALSAVSNASKLDAIAHRVRLERLRLYRMLRKLNLLKPLPSDAGYVLAEVTRGERDVIARALLERETFVFAPQQARLSNTLRFSAVSPAATRQLQSALIDIGRMELG